MRLMKGVVVVLSGMLLIITLFSLLIPSRVRVSRAVVINNADPAVVYRQIIPFENWKNWHPIFTADSAIFSREAKDKCFHIIHRQQDILLQLQKADSNSIQFSLQTKGANDIQNEMVIHSLPSQQAVQVEWRTITRLNWYPWEKFYGIFLDQLTGPSYEGALTGLKNLLEGRQVQQR